MAKSLRQMGDLLQDIDVVIEARDARLPLTSINKAFDDVLAQSWGPTWRENPMGIAAGAAAGPSTGANAVAGGSSMFGTKVDALGKMREKIVVYTKRDLAEEKYEQVGRAIHSPAQLLTSPASDQGL
jgi:hypothetical protein